MLLENQVDLLRENLRELRQQEFALPLMGDLGSTKQTYKFKSLVHPARDIATTIARADPGGDKLPTHLRGWNLDAVNELQQPQRISLKDLLGMVIHVYYLRIGEGNLDLSNDRGERFIVPYQVFLDSIERLVLPLEDVCLVICSLVEEQIKDAVAKQKKQKKALQEIPVLTSDTPGLGDLEHFLRRIQRWPPLQESIWETFFADGSGAVTRRHRTVDDIPPYIRSSQFIEPDLLWRLGWRREAIQSETWVSVSRLTEMIQKYFSRKVGHTS